MRIFTVLVYEFATGKGRTLMPELCGSFSNIESAEGYQKDCNDANEFGKIIAEIIPNDLK